MDMVMTRSQEGIKEQAPPCKWLVFLRTSCSRALATATHHCAIMNIPRAFAVTLDLPPAGFRCTHKLEDLRYVSLRDLQRNSTSTTMSCPSRLVSPTDCYPTVIVKLMPLWLAGSCSHDHVILSSTKPLTLGFAWTDGDPSTATALVWAGTIASRMKSSGVNPASLLVSLL
jgi:hypothetical protein